MPEASAKPDCPYCGSEDTVISDMYSVALGGMRRVLECPRCGCTQPLPRHADAAASAQADGQPAPRTVSDDLLRIADDMQLRTELDECVGRATVRRWARCIRAVAENAG